MGWQHAPLQTKTDLLRQIHAIEPHQRFNFETAAVDILPVPFYPAALLIRCRAPEWKPGSDYLWYVKPQNNEIIALDGSIANIHHLNAQTSLRLTKELLPAYLRFRLYFGKDGDRRRYVLQDRPMDIETADHDFICACFFYEDQNLYTGRFRITPRGETTLLEKNSQAARIGTQPLPEFGF